MLTRGIAANAPAKITAVSSRRHRQMNAAIRALISVPSRLCEPFHKESRTGEKSHDGAHLAAKVAGTFPAKVPATFLGILGVRSNYGPHLRKRRLSLYTERS